MTWRDVSSCYCEGSVGGWGRWWWCDVRKVARGCWRGVEECGRLCERFPYESSCFLLHNLLMRFHAFEPLQEMSLGDFMLFAFFMRFHAFGLSGNFLIRCHGLWALKDFMSFPNEFSCVVMEYVEKDDSSRMWVKFTIMKFPYDIVCFLLHYFLTRFD